jgi:hypothetical protein
MLMGGRGLSVTTEAHVGALPVPVGSRGVPVGRLRAVAAFVRSEPYSILYILLALGELALTLVRFSNRQGIGSDFWEHSAVVRELATHPLHPRHPELVVNAPHAFFSPYTLAVGLFARLSGLDAVSALLLVGPLNLILFLLAFYWFVASITRSTRTPGLALLFMLLLWGDNPWTASGIYNLRSLASINTYPSTFAMALALCSLAGALAYLRSGQVRYLVVVLGAVPVVVITHPLTAVLMYIFIAAIWIGLFSPAFVRRFTGLAAVVLLGSLLALSWPYYSLLTLFTAPDAFFDQVSRTFTDGIVERTFPAFLGLPLIALRLRRNLRDPLSLSFLALLAVYVGSILAGKWGYSRVISYLVLVLQIVVADWAVRSKPPWRTPDLASAAGLLLYAGIGACLVLSLFDMQSFLGRSLKRSETEFRDYSFLAGFCQQYDVVLSDLSTSLAVPPFGGKVVAMNRPLHFVPDADARRRDVRSFFSGDASAEDRARILARYGVDWLLVNTAESAVPSSMLPSLKQLGKVVYSDNTRKLTLIKVDVVDDALGRSP